MREKLPDFDEAEEQENLTEQKINEIFDQKNYVEELNQRLE